MWAILTSEFFWGIIIGAVLTALGAWLLIILQRKQQRNLVRAFCADEIRTLQALVKEMDEQRDRARAIYHDYLALIEVEIGIYGRNREHIVHLPTETRRKVRSFFNNLAVKRAEVAAHLAEFYRLNEEANKSGAIGGDAAAIRAEATAKLAEAHRAADRMVALANDAKDLVRELGGEK